MSTKIKTVDNKKTLKDKINATFFIKNMLYFILFLLVVVLTLSTDKFMTVPNIVSVLRQISIQAIIAVGMTMIIILGQMDLSVGAIVAFSSVVNALLLNRGVPLLLSIIITLIISSIWGFISGGITARYKIHSFLVTLAMLTVIRGITYTLTGGYPIGGLPETFYSIGAGHLGIIPYPVIYMIGIYLIGYFILNWTPFGRSIYAIGGNAEASHLSGLNVEKVKVAVFVVSSMLAALAGIILSSRLMAGSPEVGEGWELDIVAAVIIGGTNLFGGEGKLTGTLLGMLFVGILTNGMVLLGIQPYMQQVIRGLVILGAVVLNSFEQK